MTSSITTEKIGFNTDINLFEDSSGGTIVHLPLHGRAFRISDQAKSLIESLMRGEEILKDEISNEIFNALQNMGIIGGQKQSVPQTIPLESFNPVEATLIFTEQCNLSCSYCYASSTNEKVKPMSEEVARAAVNLVLENATHTEKNLARFRYIGGGEPTMEWDLLTSITNFISERAKELGVRHYIRLITNGTLLQPERVEWISRNLQFITLSFDILPELQAMRPYTSGKSTHSKLIEVVSLLCKNGLDFHLRTTISREGAGRLVEMVQYVHEHTQAKSIRFEPMAEIGRSVDTGIEKPAQEIFVESFKAAYRLGKELGIDVTCKMFTNKMRRNSRFCEAEFAVAPTGVISACHRYSREEHNGFDQFRIGYLDQGHFQFDMERLNALRSIDVHSFEECKTCVAKWNCAGGCLSARIKDDGISEKGPLCDLTRDLLKFSIEEQLESIQ
jgi:uncharacterized protein